MFFLFFDLTSFLLSFVFTRDALQSDVNGAVKNRAKKALVLSINMQDFADSEPQLQHMKINQFNRTQLQQHQFFLFVSLIYFIFVVFFLFVCFYKRRASFTTSVVTAGCQRHCCCCCCILCILGNDFSCCVLTPSLPRHVKFPG